MSMQKKEKI